MREGGKEGGRKGRREGGREGGREGEVSCNDGWTEARHLAPPCNVSPRTGSLSIQFVVWHIQDWSVPI